MNIIDGALNGGFDDGGDGFDGWLQGSSFLHGAFDGGFDRLLEDDRLLLGGYDDNGGRLRGGFDDGGGEVGGGGFRGGGFRGGGFRGTGCFIRLLIPQKIFGTNKNNNGEENGNEENGNIQRRTIVSNPLSDLRKIWTKVLRNTYQVPRRP